MSDKSTAPGGAAPPAANDEGKIPPMQSLLDNPFLLLFIGVTIPAVLYIMWGVMEIANIPLAD
ncbi:MAG: hypothetical protein SFV19_17170 [Rhodospirillaceae bacterium]|nr:hypothetical protein [Rhodospirillaceae bacterium]